MRRFSRKVCTASCGVAPYRREVQQVVATRFDREYRQILAARGVRQSMSGTGNCYDIAAAESFFASLKKELVHRVVFATRTEAYDAVSEYIDFYNTRRLHSSNGYQTPIDYERLDKPVAAA
jgi:transposase InsO family protein